MTNLPYLSEHVFYSVHTPWFLVACLQLEHGIIDYSVEFWKPQFIPHNLLWRSKEFLYETNGGGDKKNIKNPKSSLMLIMNLIVKL